MRKIKAICVYCGSHPGNDPAFVAAARELGEVLAENGVRLIYGGGSLGLMGALSQAAMDNGGKVVGVIPEFLKRRERASADRHELIVTRDLHERKRQMFELADAIVALPGGIGTLEELVEQITWAQLGQHRKPILLANIGQFWDPLCALFAHMKELAFIRPGFAVDLLIADQIRAILPMLERAASAVPESELGLQGISTGQL
jgi:uncharacterized protein (TIGR00730 family)